MRIRSQPETLDAPDIPGAVWGEGDRHKQLRAKALTTNGELSQMKFFEGG